MSAAISHELKNALKDAKNGHARSQQSRIVNGTAKPKHLSSSVKTPPKSGSNIHIEQIILSDDELREHLGIVNLDDLSNKHLNAEQAVWLDSFKQRVRAWRKKVKESQGLSFIFCSPDVGIGKTHTAKAVMNSFSDIRYPDGSVPTLTRETSNGITSESLNAHLDSYGRIFTAEQLMTAYDQIGKRDQYGAVTTMQSIVTPTTRILVIDDVGREGNLKFVAKENQEVEKRTRYFEIINYCYEVGVSLFITSNMSLKELRQFFNMATWSRLQEMAPKGYMIEPTVSMVDHRPIIGGRE